MAMYFNNILPTNAGSLATLTPGHQQNFAEFNNARITELAAEAGTGVSLEREKEIGREVWLIEQTSDFRRLALPNAARFITYGGDVRNMYQQSRGGECCHQGGHLLEVVWLDR